MKKAFNIFYILVFLLSFCVLPAQNRFSNPISGEGERIQKSIDLPSFTGIRLGIPANVVLQQGASQEVSIEAQANIIENIKQKISGETWNIEFYNRARRTKDITIKITLPEITYLHVSGSGNISGKEKLTNNNKMETFVSGSGNMNLNIAVADLNAKVSGSGNIKLKGAANDVFINVSGSGSFNGFDLSSNNCEAIVSGSGNCKISVSSKLMATVSGSGHINYKGNPENYRTKVSGSGNVSKAK